MTQIHSAHHFTLRRCCAAEPLVGGSHARKMMPLSTSCLGLPPILPCSEPLKLGTHFTTGISSAHDLEYQVAFVGRPCGGTYTPGEMLQAKTNAPGLYVIELSGGATFVNDEECDGSRVSKRSSFQLQTAPAISTSSALGTISIRHGRTSADGQFLVSLPCNLTIAGTRERRTVEAAQIYSSDAYHRQAREWAAAKNSTRWRKWATHRAQLDRRRMTKQSKAKGATLQPSDDAHGLRSGAMSEDTHDDTSGDDLASPSGDPATDLPVPPVPAPAPVPDPVPDPVPVPPPVPGSPRSRALAPSMLTPSPPPLPPLPSPPPEPSPPPFLPPPQMPAPPPVPPGYMPLSPSPPPPPPIPCRPDAAAWDVGYGSCETYSPGHEGDNFNFPACFEDRNWDAYVAWEVCPECGLCVIEWPMHLATVNELVA